MTEITVVPIVKVHAQILDPFGGVMAEGELHVPHVPGADDRTPSLADQVRRQFTNRRLELPSVPGVYEGPPCSIRITEA